MGARSSPRVKASVPHLLCPDTSSSQETPTTVWKTRDQGELPVGRSDFIDSLVNALNVYEMSDIGKLPKSSVSVFFHPTIGSWLPCFYV